MNNLEQFSWNRGDVIVERHATSGKVTGAFPLWVWSDDGTIIVTYLPIGAAYQGQVGEDGEPTREVGAKRVRVSRIWERNHVLRFFREGDEYGMLLFFNADWSPLCWYVNLQEPVRRIPQGLETRDLTLDLLIAPDLSGHRWKDIDEFEDRIEAGIYAPSELERLMEIGRGVLQDAAESAWPFDRPWLQWRPPSHWGLADLPDGWDG
ncbi:MAG TPA: DUF402 domain-containing protein [Pseudomonadales bacterium]|nr:DUF402 domain-containing protein [Pseudomonadales bacterium]